MSGFDRASNVEHRGMVRLMPFLEEQSGGRVIRIGNGPLARRIQADFGDVMMNTAYDTVWAVEIKIEEKWTGRLFLEIWSNRNLEDRENHALHGSRPGWLHTQRADILLYYFYDLDRLVALPLFRLQQWAFRDLAPGTKFTPRIYSYEQKSQKKYNQPNDTWGAVVPIADIARDMAIGHYSVKQLELPGTGSVALPWFLRMTIYMLSFFAGRRHPTDARSHATSGIGGIRG